MVAVFFFSLPATRLCATAFVPCIRFRKWPLGIMIAFTLDEKVSIILSCLGLRSIMGHVKSEFLPAGNEESSNLFS